MENTSVQDGQPTIQLVRHAKAGDKRSLEALFERYLPRVRQIVALRLRKTLRELDDVEDLVQESLLVIFKNLHAFENRSEGSFRNWVSHCVQSRIVEHYRRRGAEKRGSGKVLHFGELRNQSVLASSIFAGNEPTPSEILKGKELESKIEKGLLALADHDRELIILSRMCEFSYAEIAKEFGFQQEATVRKAVSRALGKLREYIKE